MRDSRQNEMLMHQVLPFDARPETESTRNAVLVRRVNHSPKLTLGPTQFRPASYRGSIRLAPDSTLVRPTPLETSRLFLAAGIGSICFHEMPYGKASRLDTRGNWLSAL